MNLTFSFSFLTHVPLVYAYSTEKKKRMLSSILRSLRGPNLEVFKFGMYILFPIGWMYYFGTNLENRFSVPDFWPSQEQSHRIPFERDEIRDEVMRIARETRERELRKGLDSAKMGLVRRKEVKPEGGGGGEESVETAS